MDPSTETIPFYKSAIVKRLALSMAMQILAITHLSKYIASEDVAALVNYGLEALGLAYASWALHARATKVIPPIVLTQAKADVVNQEKAAAAVAPQPMSIDPPSIPTGDVK